jgi:hypothetical protein
MSALIGGMVRHHGEEAAVVALVDSSLVGGGREALGGVGADRFKHRQPGGGLRVRAAGEQLLGDHAVEHVEVGGGDGFRRLRRGAAGEHGEARKARLLGVSQQVVAPVDGRAQRLLACGRVAGAGPERAERGVQAFGDSPVREARSGRPPGARPGSVRPSV